MNRLSVIVIGLALTLTACSAFPLAFGAQTPVPTASPAEAPPLDTPTPAPLDITAAQRAAIAALAQSLAIPADQIRLVSSEAVTWPNGCMGVPRVGALCAQGQVPGFKLVLGANGKQYEYHTNLDGTIMVPAEAMLVQGPAEEAAMKQLAANLSIPESDVKLVSSAAVQWPDSCLGVALERVMCAQIVTPGHIIVLEAGGRQFEYHTNNDASSIMPAMPALDWKQEGGIAGLCQSLTVFLSGEVYGMNCAAGGDGRMAVLNAGQRERLYSWIDALANTSIDLSDPKGVADGMTRSADLLSRGAGAATDADKRAIFDFGQTLYRQIYR